MGRRTGWTVVIVVTSIIVVSLILSGLIDARFQQGQRAITCLSAETNIQQLEAIASNGDILRQIAQELGLPVEFPPPIVIPEVPPECEGI